MRSKLSCHLYTSLINPLNLVPRTFSGFSLPSTKPEKALRARLKSPCSTCFEPGQAFWLVCSRAVQFVDQKVERKNSVNPGFSRLRGSTLRPRMSIATDRWPTFRGVRLGSMTSWIDCGLKLKPGEGSEWLSSVGRRCAVFTCVSGGISIQKVSYEGLRSCAAI